MANNPLFVSFVAAASALTTTGDYRLHPTCSLTGWSDNTAYLTARDSLSNFAGETDLAGLLRFSDNTIDLGAYEYPLATPVANRLTTDSSPVRITSTAARTSPSRSRLTFPRRTARPRRCTNCANATG